VLTHAYSGQVSAWLAAKSNGRSLAVPYELLAVCAFMLSVQTSRNRESLSYRVVLPRQVADEGLTAALLHVEGPFYVEETFA
ncbi:MAG: hypothetical protein WBX22_29335, partial [Silvibacterium sp.]